MLMFALIAVSSCGDVIQGTPGPRGSPGPAGSPGPKGETGSEGPAGQDGTMITVVKFCSETPSYPTTFPEVGLCINNSIFAVYSTNGGFLALIPPGRYTSNGVGSACNFTVYSNCVVTEDG